MMAEHQGRHQNHQKLIPNAVS